jgi:D-glucuronyl C5-epimerase-like protein
MKLLGARERRAFPVFAVSVAISVPLVVALPGEPVTTARAERVATQVAPAAPPVVPGGPGTDPEEGVALPPAAGAAGVEQRITQMEAKSAAATSRPLPDTYTKGPFVPRPVADSALPYNSSAVYEVPVDRDATGVAMYRLPADGKLYNHPVHQAEDALAALNNYRLTGRAAYLNRAVLDAQRLIDRRVVSDEAWYYPYPYDFALHGGSDIMRAPWFSGMAQGQALNVFVRLNRVTGDQKWRDAADATFNSFRNAPVQGLPSTVHIDGTSNYLWLEEWPRWPPESSDRTFNGHVFAAFGLYDYLRLTGDPIAIDLWKGALENARYQIQYQNRNPGYISSYCLRHPSVLSAKYHDIHWHQMLSLHASTGDSGWSRIADVLRADYPPPAVSGTVVLMGGSHTGYRFDKNGAITGHKSITFNRRTSAPGDQRIRIKGRGIYLRITAGYLAGYLVPESYERARFAGVKVQVWYPLSRTVRIPAGTWTAYQYNAAGTVTARKTIRPTSVTSASFLRSAIIDGRLQVRVTSGTLANYWLPAQGMTLV